jgi:hypothetical protein
MTFHPLALQSQISHDTCSHPVQQVVAVVVVAVAAVLLAQAVAVYSDLTIVHNTAGCAGFGAAAGVDLPGSGWTAGVGLTAGFSF